MSDEIIRPSQLVYSEYGRDIAAAKVRSILMIADPRQFARGKAIAPSVISRTYAGGVHNVLLNTRELLDNAATNQVFGYFVGGGWAFGLVENTDYRITAQTYEDYKTAATGDDFPVQYTDKQGNIWTETVKIGADIPRYLDLTLVDQAAVRHDQAMRQAQDTWKQNRITNPTQADAILKGDKHIANLELIAAADAIQFPSLSRSSFATTEDFQRAQLLQLQQKLAARYWIGLKLRAAVLTPFASNDPSGPTLNAQFGLGEGDIEPALYAQYVREVFGGTDADAQQRLKDAVKVANKFQAQQGFIEAGDVLGSSIGRVIAGDNAIKGIVYTSLLGEFGKRLAGTIAGGGRVETALPGAMDGAMASFSSQFASRMQIAGVGVVSSLLTTELGQALGLKGFGAELFGTTTQSVLQTAIQNVTVGDASHLFDGFHFDRAGAGFGDDLFAQGGAGSLAVTAIASFVGAKLGSLVVAPQTQAAAALSTIGSAAGAWAATSATVGISTAIIGGSTGAQAFLLGNLVLPGVGAFVGFALGALVGNLFGKKPPKPAASAEVALQLPLARYEIGTVTSNPSGNRDLVQTMASTARDLLNGYVGLVATDTGPTYVTNLNGLATDQVYGHSGSQVYVTVNGARTDVSSPDKAVDVGARAAIKNTRIVGGDMLAKRAILKSTAADMTALAGDIQAAKDYRTYLTNRSLIDDTIAGAYGALTSADETYYAQASNKVWIDKLQSLGQTALSPSELSSYLANKAQADKIVHALEAQESANGWLITLQHAVGELKLDQFATSDFYGGLKGFLGSLNPATFYLGYEDFTLSSVGGGLNIAVIANGYNDGFFNPVPGAATDGYSVIVPNFTSGGVGYSGWSGVTGMAGNNFIDISGAGAGQLVADFGSADASTGGDDIAIGSAYNDTLQGRLGSDWVDGGAGNDVLVGGQDQDVLVGGVGDDSLFGDKGDDYLTGGAGNDIHYGGDGNDTFSGKGGVDQMYGELGDDVFIINADGGATSDVMDGGGGNDMLSYERFTTAVTVNLATGAYYGDTWTAVEGVTGTDLNDGLTGDAAANRLRGRAGADVLSGLDGDDVLEGGDGVDQLNGGNGTDTASYETSVSGVYVDLAGVAYGGDADGDLFSGIENLRGSAFADLLKGSAGVVTNRLEGLAGDDWLVATAGADVFDGGDGKDFVDYADATSGVTLYLGSYANFAYGAGSGSGGMAAGQSFIKVDGVIGSAFGDNLSAGAGDQTLGGGKGSDTLAGGAGADTYLFNRGDGFDLINEDASGWNTLSFGKDVLFQDLMVQSAGGVGGFLDLSIRGSTGDTVRIAGNWADANLPKLKTLDLGGVAKLDLDVALNVPSATDGDDLVNGTDNFGDLLFGLNGNDIMRARATGVEQIAHVFVGGRGNDIEYGSTGDDSYAFDVDTGLAAGQVQTDYVDEAGGFDTIVFGPSVRAEDLIYQVMGNSDLIIGVKDPANPDLLASQTANFVQIHEGGKRYYRVDLDRYEFREKTVEFVEVGGATLDLRKLDLPWVTINDFGPNPGAPIVLDLDGDGLDLSTFEESRVVVKSATGVVTKLGWVGPTDGILAVDRDGDGGINRLSEISFTQDKKGATTDLEGLATWDTNGDGVLDAKDKDWGKLLVWTDRNQNGRSTRGELKSLDAAGVTSINLKGVATGYDASTTGESFIQNTLSYATRDGKSGSAFDVALARRLINSEGAGAAEYRTAWGDLNADGELGRVLNDVRVDAFKAAGKTYDASQREDRRGLSYDQFVAAAKFDFGDDGVIDPGIARQYAYRLDPAARAEWILRQAPMFDKATFDRLVATPASPDRPTIAPAVKGAATPLSATANAPVAEDLEVAPTMVGAAAAQPEDAPADGVMASLSGDDAAAPVGARSALTAPLEPPPAAAITGSQPEWWRDAGLQSLGYTDAREVGGSFGGPAYDGVALAPTAETNAAAGETIDPQRRLQLLRQAMAGFGGDAGGSAAIWTRGADPTASGGLAGETRSSLHALHQKAA